METPINVNSSVEVVTISNYTLKLDDKILRDLLIHAGYDVPESLFVAVRVPGGGDWANTDLDIEPDCPVIVKWSGTETEKEAD